MPKPPWISPSDTANWQHIQSRRLVCNFKISMTSIPVSSFTDWFDLPACRNDTPTDTKSVTMLKLRTSLQAQKYYLPDCEQNVWEHSFLLVYYSSTSSSELLKSKPKIRDTIMLHHLWTWIFALHDVTLHTSFRWDKDHMLTSWAEAFFMKKFGIHNPSSSLDVAASSES